MAAWMVVTRLPALTAAGIGPEDAQRTQDLGSRLPPNVQWKADNYNHLMEQPTIFYAVALALAVAGLGEGLNTWMAWLYVGSRVVHSLVQVTTNVVMIRFTIFIVGTIALLVMSVNGALQLMS